MRFSDYLSAIPSYLRQVILVGIIGLIFSLFKLLEILGVIGFDVPVGYIIWILLPAYVTINFVIYSRQRFTILGRELEPDKKLFGEFTQALPFFPTIDFLMEQDFGNIVQIDKLNPLLSFERQWRDALHRFHHRILEKQRAFLYNSILEFIEFGASNTSPHIKLDGYVRINGEGTDFDKRATEWNRLAELVISSHQKIVALGKTILGL